MKTKDRIIRIFTGLILGFFITALLGLFLTAIVYLILIVVLMSFEGLTPTVLLITTTLLKITGTISILGAIAGGAIGASNDLP
ncbi:MAG: hypothetical protein Q8J68_07810 [Methanolobus sp.]|uniref:hypothetical protein n=1 Tax=Methanolobus sp. TaxID=1874737 RepID=UPI00273055EB|nr:hypothetical protein [Methanolobus sp.]MDP2217173.1 hypothetical protein [Methanolobus sp.]